MSERNLFQVTITKNLEVTSNFKITIDNKSSKVPVIINNRNKTLVIILSWILAEKKHLQKFYNIYLAKNFDVLTVSITLKQLLWPTNGAQVVAQSLLDFLYENKNYECLLVHGFSVGGYVWGEFLVKIKKDLNKYQPLINKIVGQIWDSTPDITEFHKGFPQAVFPTSHILRNIFEKIIEFHLTTFSESTTQNYLRSSQHFHNTPVRAPVLIFVAENDTIASLKSILNAKNTWESLGMMTYLKSWKNSQHVSHLHLHREEYLESLEKFLSTLNIPGTQEKLQAKL